jgi:hypothetical protein
MPRFSQFFGLGLTQAELDFVDIPVETDVALFLDPYALSVDEDPMFVECNNIVVDFFERVLHQVRRGDSDEALNLLRHVGEANETHLGFSRGTPSGSGIGSEKARRLYDNLRRSTAVMTGSLSDLAELDLFVEGVAEDNISDLTTNIVRSQLHRYTAEQCVKYGIPLREVAGGFCWNTETHAWENHYADLPVVNGRKVLLVPKASVRHYLALNAEDFYNDFVLDYLQGEHLSANTSLVHLLKNGKRRVYKKDVKAANPFSKNFLAEFTNHNPSVLEGYRRAALLSSEPLRDEQIEQKQPQPQLIDINSLVQKLVAIPTGNSHATAFHRCALGIIEAAFYPGLRGFRVEHEINDGRKRIDIIATNGGSGFFGNLMSLHNIPAGFVPIECKNYSQDPENPELDQLLGRLSPQRGRFGLLICRHITDKARTLMRCRDAVHNGQGFILVLDDADLTELLSFRAGHQRDAIQEFLSARLLELLS